MGVQVQDPRKLLSKHQIQKIKSMVGKYVEESDAWEDGLKSFLVKQILPSIHYAEDVKEPYNRVSGRKDEVSGHVVVSFAYQSPEELHERLRTRLKVHTSLRKTSDDTDSELWKRYALLKKFARANVRIPTPTDVQKERQIFEQIVENMPNSNFKTYVQDCLA